MYVCPYATVNKIRFACKYRDDAMDANRDLGLMDDLRGTKSYIKPIEPACPIDVRRDERGNIICWQIFGRDD